MCVLYVCMEGFNACPCVAFVKVCIALREGINCVYKNVCVVRVGIYSMGVSMIECKGVLVLLKSNELIPTSYPRTASPVHLF